MKRILKVFPRKTRATPDDDLVRFGPPDLFDEADEIHVSVTFTWDIKKAEMLAKAWKPVAPVLIGGPAFGKPEGNFVPGQYLKKNWVITSRGCNNKCPHCMVWQRNGEIRELPITDGHIVQDDNLLGCSQQHIVNVFEMLRKQKERVDLRGLEAKMIKEWHIDLFNSVRISQLWFAYDEEEDYEPLLMAGRMLYDSGYTYENRKARCYVLIGYGNDTQEKALIRLHRTIDAGFMPFAMLYKDENGNSQPWHKFQREWTRPAIISTQYQRKVPAQKSFCHMFISRTNIYSTLELP